MSIPKLPRNHDPKAFALSLLRENDCCKLILPDSTLEVSSYTMWNDPLKNFMRVARDLHLPPPPQGYDYERLLKFSWDTEGSGYVWNYRPLHGVPFFRLNVVFHCCPQPKVLVDTVLDSREFARQVWREAHALLRDRGLALFNSEALYSEFPFGDFVRLHHIVTGEPVPRTLSEEVALLTRLATEAPPQA